VNRYERAIDEIILDTAASLAIEGKDASPAAVSVHVTAALFPEICDLDHIEACGARGLEIYLRAKAVLE
jgi:hypothetical protein